MAGFKHLIECHCVLPQYRNLDEPVFHKLVVFSKVDESGEVIPKLCKCNNCGVIHKVVDFCKTEITYGIDETSAVVSEIDIRSNISEEILNILDSHKCDLATWEQVDDIVTNEEWGSVVVISRQQVADSTQIKCLTLRDANKFKIDTHLRQDDIK
jgi:hypothetical protein